MKKISVDVAVIGAGTAGMAAYRAAKSHGGNVVLIEGGPYGTTCARVGCMPSKLLIAAAEAAHAIENAPRFGVHASVVRIDGKEVMARVRSERDRFVGFVLEGVESIPSAERLRGHARFVDSTTLQIDDHTLVKAARIVIATGSTPQIPDGMKELGKRVIVNDDVFDWDDLPESVAVVGTGVIGLELGQALHRLGVRVVMFGRAGAIAQIGDPAVLASAQEYFSTELDLRLNSNIVSAQLDGNEVVVTSKNDEVGERTERFSFLLAATGRKPNVTQLGLDTTGIELDSRGIPSFDSHTMQCGQSTIFIAGDVNAELPLLHEAADHGRIAGDNAGRYPDVRSGLRRSPITVAFTDPQIATVGQGFRKLKADNYVAGEVSFVNQGRSRVMLQNHGMLKVYGERVTGRFLGAEMFGPRAEHIAHLLAWAHQNQMTVEQMLDMPFYHPVIEEGVRTALRDLSEALSKQVSEIEHCTDCTPGM